MRQIRGFFRSGGAKCTEIWSEKSPNLSHLGPFWPTLNPNLPSLVGGGVVVTAIGSSGSVLLLCVCVSTLNHESLLPLESVPPWLVFNKHLVWAQQHSVHTQEDYFTVFSNKCLCFSWNHHNKHPRGVKSVGFVVVVFVFQCVMCSVCWWYDENCFLVI